LAAHVPLIFSLDLLLNQCLSPTGTTFPKQGQTAVVHYTGMNNAALSGECYLMLSRKFLLGTLDNGTVFDSSRTRGKPFKFKIGKGEVIRGWDDGVAQLSVGQRAKLICSPDYAYGARGMRSFKVF
jgi:FKBP-type peptidyl-prolyl cis-trans isomerase